jgi:hypothetical protein
MLTDEGDEDNNKSMDIIIASLGELPVMERFRKDL